MSKLGIYVMIIAQTLSMAFATEGNSQRKLLEEIFITLTPSQDARPVISVMEEIENNTDLTFAYAKRLVRDKTVELEGGQISVGEILNEISVQAKISFKRINENVGVAPPKANVPLPDIEDKLLQIVTITGKVIDDQKEPLPGATVLEQGTGNGTITDIDGNFSMDVYENAILLVSFVGYKTQEVQVGASKEVNVTLELDVESLEEVVVIGYGQVDKKDLTGSVSSVKANEIEKTVNTSFQDALIGRAAGVQVQMGEGSPGGDVSMRIRGGTSISASNEPLYVIDGFPIIDEKTVGSSESYAGTTTNVLAGISPNDIKSIEILKDASATAIYGSRGANGVIIITTKTGDEDGDVPKAALSYDTYFGIKASPEQLEVMDPVEYATYRRSQYAPGTGFYYLFENPESYADSTAVNWQDEIFRKAYIQNHNININGGYQSFRYNFSTGYFRDEGIIVGSKFERLNARLNLRGDLSDKLRFKFMLFETMTKQDGVPTGGANGGRSGVVTQALYYSPIIPAGNTFEDPTTDVGGNGNYNPIVQLKGTTLESDMDRFMGNISLEYDILEDLTFQVLMGSNVVNAKYGRFYSTNTGLGALYGGRSQLDDVNRREWINENTLTYKTSFDKHSFTLLGGYTMQASRAETFQVINTGYDIEDLGLGNIGFGTIPFIPNSDIDEWSLMSGLSRLSYDYDGRYLVTLSFRADGSSRFADGNKWGYFPAAAVAWRLSDEAFMSGLNEVVSDFKFRFGYGRTGNQEVRRYQSVSSLSSNYYSIGEDNGLTSVSVAVDRVANPDLTWEVTTQYNLGVDIGLFNDRFTATADVYRKKTSDLLLAINLVASSGISAPALQNAGSLQNTGLEIAFNSVNVHAGDFKWTSNFNIAFNKNEILDLGRYDQIYVDAPGGNHGIVNEIILQPGHSLSTFYGYETDGIRGIPAEATAADSLVAGSRVIVDQNGDGEITEDDRVVLGSGLPIHYGGFTNNFTYKAFDLSVFFNWSYGNDVYNVTRYYLEEEHFDGRNKNPVVLDGWSYDNQDSKQPRFGKGEVGRFTDTFIEDGSYLRLRNVTLGYTMSKGILKNGPVAYARLYVSAQNLFTITGYKGYNPDANTSSNPAMQGIDWGAYPLSTVYTMGLNVRF